jgi:Fic family protein
MKSSTKPKSATSYKDTSLGILPREKVVELEKQGVKRALEYVISLSEKKTAITPQVILDIHREGFGFIFAEWAGKYRTIEVTVGEYIPPQAHEIPVLVKNLTEDLNERLKYIPSSEEQEKFLSEAVALLAWFQNRFVWIHPFQDYNGRVARLLTNLLALNLNLPLFEIQADTEKDRNTYIEAMKEADKHDYSKLEKLIGNALQESLEKM